MERQDLSNRRPHRPGPLRWVVAVLCGLLLTALVVLTLMPRLVGGLLNRGHRTAGGFAGEDWEATTILWDVGDLAEENGPAPENPPEETTEPERDAEAVPIDETATTPPPERPAGGGGTPRPAGDPGPAVVPAPASEGSGAPVGDGRRSPRVLYQEWPDQKLLESLDESGSLSFRLRVEADGHVSSYEVLRTFDCEACLEEAARIIASLRFIPGTYAGRPVACWIPYEIEFNTGSGR